MNNTLVDKIPIVELETNHNLPTMLTLVRTFITNHSNFNAQFNLIMFAWYYDGECITLFQFQISMKCLVQSSIGGQNLYFQNIHVALYGRKIKLYYSHNTKEKCKF
jgi:hypothetical protein